MKNFVKKAAVWLSVAAITTGGLTGCVYSPQLSGTDNASGAAVSGGAMADQKDKKSETGEENKSIKSKLKCSYDGKWSSWINSEYQSSRYFYAVMNPSNVSKESAAIYQITPDGRKRKKTGVEVKVYHPNGMYSGIALLSVDSDWVYYEIDGKIYRVPIVAENESERLDVKQKECLVKKCSGAGAAFIDEQKLYYMTESELTCSKTMVRENIQIHCLDLETGEKRSCPEKIVKSEGRSVYKDYYSKGEYLGVCPDTVITGDYIYYVDVNDYPDYLYQLNKSTMELLRIDKLKNDVNDYSDYNYDISDNGDILWYIKVTGDDDKDTCPYEICSYDVRKQSKKVLATGEECLTVICEEEKLNPETVSWVDIEDIIYCDENKLYIEYSLGLQPQKKKKKKVWEYRDGVLVCSLSSEQPEVLSGLGEYYKKYTRKYEDEISSDMYCEGVLENGNKLLMCVENDREEQEFYAVYDMETNLLTKISDKKADRLIEKLEEIEEQKNSYFG